jgi:hypothetical protein
MTADLADRLEATTAEAAAALRLQVAPKDWLDEILADGGDGLKSDEAAFIAGCSPDTIHRRAKAAAAAGKPIGVLFAGAVWLLSERRLVVGWLGAPQLGPAETSDMKYGDLR